MNVKRKVIITPNEAQRELDALVNKIDSLSAESTTFSADKAACAKEITAIQAYISATAAQLGYPLHANGTGSFKRRHLADAPVNYLQDNGPDKSFDAVANSPAPVIDYTGSPQNV